MNEQFIAKALILIYENEIDGHATEEQRKKWREGAIKIGDDVVGSPFVDGQDISIFKNAAKFVKITQNSDKLIKASAVIAHGPIAYNGGIGPITDAICLDQPPNAEDQRAGPPAG
jgi:hypothetical protein